MPYNSKRKNLDVQAQIDNLKEYKGRYDEIVPNIKRIGYQLDQGEEYARGGLAIGHTGPLNKLGKSSGPADKAAQLHDIGYGVLGSSAYINYNEADEKYLEDLKDINNPTALIGKTYFNIKKAIAPNMSKSGHTSPLKTPSKKPYSRPGLSQSPKSSYHTPESTPTKNQSNQLAILPANMKQEGGNGGDVDMENHLQVANPNDTIVPTAMNNQTRGMRTMVHTAAMPIAPGTTIIKLSNTYKVFMSNADDLDVTKDPYAHWQESRNDDDAIDTYYKNAEIHPIYGYNRSKNAAANVDGSCPYVKLPWKLLPTLKNENYVTPNDWDNILRMGYTKMKILKRKTKLHGLYQLHNYQTSEQGEVQVQGSPFIEVCQPKGQYFKHEHYPILRQFDSQPQDPESPYAPKPFDPTSTKGVIDMVIMNAVPSFVVGDPRDCQAMGFGNTSILDFVKGDVFDGSENTLRNYYYPIYYGQKFTTTAQYLDDARLNWPYWYPDISRTQDVLLTDNLDGIEFDVPCDDTAINMSDYLLWARPGQKLYEASALAPNQDKKFILADYSTCAIGLTTYNQSTPNELDFMSYQKHDFDDWAPVLLRAPNHYNTGNSTIVNNCYFYVTYECEVEVSQHEFVPTSTYLRPMNWEPISYRDLSYRKLYTGYSGDYQYTDDSRYPRPSTNVYQSNLRYAHNYNPAGGHDNPTDCKYQASVINDTIYDISAGMVPMRHIAAQIINSTQADNQVLHKLSANGQRMLQN